MAYLSDWTQGTITVTNGSAVVTGVGTVWNGAGLQEGDEIIANNLIGIILTRDSPTQVTLTAPWQGVTAAGIAYRARYQADGSRYTAVAKQVLQDIQSGNLSALSGLVGTANSLPMFTGPGAMSLLATGTAGRAVLAAGTVGQAAAAANAVQRSGGTNMNAVAVMYYGWSTSSDGLIGQIDTTPLGKIYNSYYAGPMGGAGVIRSEIGAFASSGGNISGPVAISSNLDIVGNFTITSRYIIAGAAAGTDAFFFLRSGTNNRWGMYKKNPAEPGSNVGADLGFARYDDASAYLGDSLTINRRYGVVETRETPACHAVPGSGNITLNTGQAIGALSASSGFNFNRGSSTASFTIGGNPGVEGRVIHVPLTGWYKIAATCMVQGANKFMALGLNGSPFANIAIGSDNWNSSTRVLIAALNANDYLHWYCVTGTLLFNKENSNITVEFFQF